MKNSFSFLAEWGPTYVITSFLTALCSGVIQMASKFIVGDNARLSSLIVWLAVMAVMSASLGRVSSKLGGEAGREGMRVSTGVPFFNMLIFGGVYVLLYVLLGGRAVGVFHLFPGEMFLVTALFGADGAASASIIEKAGICVLQFGLYMAASLIFFVLAKRKREKQSAVSHHRSEKKKPNNRFGIDIDI